MNQSAPAVFDPAGPSPQEALRLYETMVLICRVEERLRDDSAAGKLPGAVHLYIGEEAVAAGVCAPDRPGLRDLHAPGPRPLPGQRR